MIGDLVFVIALLIWGIVAYRVYQTDKEVDKEDGETE